MKNKKPEGTRYMGRVELIEPKRGNVFKVRFYGPDGGVQKGTIRLPFKTPCHHDFFRRVILETKWNDS